MPRSHRLTALAAAAATLLTAPAFAQDAPPAPRGDRIASDRTFTLQSNTTKTYRMPIAGLGESYNALEPCYGFELRGPGVSYAAANLSTFGYVFGEPAAADQPDGGIPGAERREDGSLWIDESKARVTADDEKAGRECAADGWRFVYDSERSRTAKSRGVDARAARKAGNRKRRARAFKASTPVQILFAGLEGKANGRPDLVVKIATGDLAGKTTLSTHARVLEQD